MATFNPQALATYTITHVKTFLDGIAENFAFVPPTCDCMSKAQSKPPFDFPLLVIFISLLMLAMLATYHTGKTMGKCELLTNITDSDLDPEELSQRLHKIATEMYRRLGKDQKYLAASRAEKPFKGRGLQMDESEVTLKNLFNGRGLRKNESEVTLEKTSGDFEVLPKSKLGEQRGYYDSD